MKTNKLFILVSKDIPLEDKAVQAIHVACQYLLDNKDTQTWNNQTVVYLEADIDAWCIKLDIKGELYTIFKEPDLDYKITALACQTDRHNIFSKLNLMGS